MSEAMELSRPQSALEEEAMAPRGPWAFLRASLAGGKGTWTLGFCGAWIFMQLFTGLAWARNLRAAAGTSAMPAHWGETVSARELWELWENGELKHSPFGTFTGLWFLLGLVLVLWTGWRLQAASAGVKARLTPWILGLLQTLILGLVPLGIVYQLVSWVLSKAAGTGIQGLGWLGLFGGPLLLMAYATALETQWQLRRLSITERDGFGRFGKDFLRLWRHPVQWLSLILGGAALRGGLALGAFLLSWRLGGETPGRVWLVVLIQLSATLISAWLLALHLRLVALFWRHDENVLAYAAGAPVPTSAKDASPDDWLLE